MDPLSCLLSFLLMILFYIRNIILNSMLCAVIATIASMCYSENSLSDNHSKLKCIIKALKWLLTEPLWMFEF